MQPTVKKQSRYHEYVGTDGVKIYRMDNQTKKVTDTGKRLLYSGSSRPLILGIKYVKRLNTVGNPKKRSRQQLKAIGGYKDEAWRSLADYQARVRRENSVSDVRRGKARLKKA